MIPSVSIQLDRVRALRFGMGAMVRFEQLTGLKLREMNDELSMDTTAKLLWVMLQQEDPALTLEDAIALVDRHAPNLPYVIARVTEAVTVAFTDEPLPGNAPAPATPG